MSGEPSGSGSNALSAPSKAISSLAKKPDVTRQGTAKLKFVPTLVKRKEVKPEPVAAAVPAERGRGRGRGRGEGRGRGAGRGGAAPRPAVEMTASGPFAMGPAMATKRMTPRSNFTPIVPMGPGTSASSLGAGLSRSAAPSLQKDKATKMDNEDEAEYSDPDEGVEIVDMEDVRQMDYMAPDSLRRDRTESKKKRAERIKKEDAVKALAEKKGKGIATEDDEAAAADINLANAVDLSDSEDEEELEDLIDDFALQADIQEDTDVRQERLYFFQFPSPFPTYLSNIPPPEADPEMDVDAPEGPTGTDSKGKKVSFAAGVKPPPAAAAAAGETGGEPKVDGVIGQLEVYRSGAVKMRLSNGILLDVTAATQPSFLQHAVQLDMDKKRLNILGEVNKRFTVSPNVEALIEAMDASERAIPELDEGLYIMDTT